VGSAEIIDWLRHNARTFIFSAALAPASAAAALKALEVLMIEPERVEKANANAAYLKAGLENLGLNTMNSPTTILPVFVGDDAVCLGVCQQLLKLGVFVTPVVYPAVPKGQALIRCSVMPTHTTQDLDVALKGFAMVSPAIKAANANPNQTALHDELKSTTGVKFRPEEMHA
jgi:8-amino-7-oxononanoate synthase